jgi:hypothetical protein
MVDEVAEITLGRLRVLIAPANQLDVLDHPGR